MKRLWILIALVMGLLAGARPASAQEEATHALPKLWFPVGEIIEYKLYWGIIPVGRADLISAWVKEEGRLLLSLKIKAKTTAIVRKIYRVDDVVEAIVDPVTFLPIRYTQKLREGRHRRDDLVLFDHKKLTATWKSTKRNASKTLEIKADTRDVLTLAYYMRKQQFGEGDSAAFRVMVDDKLYDLSFTGTDTERLKLSGYGRRKTLIVEPKAKFGEIFVRKGKVYLWFTQDKRRLCVRMSAKVPLARVKAIFRGVYGPGDDFWIKEKD